MAKKDIIEQEFNTPAENKATDGATIAKNANQKLLDAEAQRKRLLNVYKNEDKVPMYLSPMYRPYFGNVMQVMVNGISIFFKVDGSVQHVPKTFADEIAAKRMAVDAILTKQSRMADIPANAENAPGELNLF